MQLSNEKFSKRKGKLQLGIEWAIIANLKVLLVKCKQTNYQFRIQVRYQKQEVWSSFFKFECAAGRLQSHFLLPKH